MIRNEIDSCKFSLSRHLSLRLCLFKLFDELEGFQEIDVKALDIFLFITLWSQKRVE